MEQIGIFNLELGNVKCNDAVRNAIVAKARASAKWNDVPGNHRHYKAIETVFNTVLQGGTLEEVRAVFRATQPPASLSQVGLVFPVEIWHSLDRGEQIEAVKDEANNLMDKIEWELAHDMREPEPKNVVQAWLAQCMGCGGEHIVRELTSTLYCENCKPKYKKGKKAGNGISADTVKKNINRLAREAAKRYAENPEMQQVIADRIDEERERIGLKAMTKKQREGKPESWTV